MCASDDAFHVFDDGDDDRADMLFAGVSVDQLTNRHPRANQTRRQGKSIKQKERNEASDRFVASSRLHKHDQQQHSNHRKAKAGKEPTTQLNSKTPMDGTQHQPTNQKPDTQPTNKRTEERTMDEARNERTTEGGGRSERTTNKDPQHHTDDATNNTPNGIENVYSDYQRQQYRKIL